MIKQETIDRILEEARIEEVIGDFVVLKKRGANLLGCCPFHEEKTPSFTVSPAKGIYKCFGCGAAGNSVKFLMEHEQYSYPEALRKLAERYNIEIEEDRKQTPEEIEKLNKRESLFVITAFAEEHYMKNLVDNEEGRAIGLSYFRQRGFSDDTIKKFHLGYSLKEWSALTDLALSKGYKEEFLVQTGLTIKKDENKRYDRFRGRVVFPIHNLSGRVLGFGARTLVTDKKVPKYVNSPETEIYHKSDVLYGIYQAKKSIIKEDNCFLAEGYTDVISLHQAGIENVVASSGTSLTKGQIKLIRRFTPNITILYDGDAAGLKASFRGIDLILEEGMNVRVILFPEGEDPDSMARKSSSHELNTFITEHSQDFIRFKADILLKDAGDDPIKRAHIIKDIVDSIALIPDSITRSVYIRQTAQLFQMEERALLDELNKFRNKKLKNEYKSQSKPPSAPSSTSSFSSSSSAPPFDAPPDDYIPPEYREEGDAPIKKEPTLSANTATEEALARWLILYGDRVIHVHNENVEPEEYTIAELIIEEINEDQLFLSNEPFLTVFNEVEASLKENKLPGLKKFLNHPDSKVMDFAILISSTPYQLSENWEGLHQIYVTTEDQKLDVATWEIIYRFKLYKINSLLHELSEEIKIVTSDDALMEILQKRKVYQEIKKVFLQKLGMAIG